MIKFLIRNKKIYMMLALVLIFLSTSLLYGCSLADPNDKLGSKTETLCGLFLTLEEDIKEYTPQDGDSVKQESGKWKLYRADGSVKVLEKEEADSYFSDKKIEGTIDKNDNFNFGGIRGSYIAYTIKKEKENGKIESYGSTLSSPDVYDIDTNVHLGKDDSIASDQGWNENNEDRSTTSVTGKVAIPINYKGVVYINPIYKRANGSIYTVIPGSSGMYLQKGDSGASGQSIKESTNINISGLNHSINTKDYEFKFLIERADYLENAVIKQFDKNDRMIKMTNMAFDKSEGKLLLDQNTAYVIVEEKLIDENGKVFIKRSIYDCDKVTLIKDKDSFLGHTFKYTGKDNRIYQISLEFVRKVR